ncbi:MAG: hypothetical protein ABIQ18_31975 [Umezawaea sp.]
MLTNFKIDQVASFPAGVIFLACEPKLAFGGGSQERTPAGDWKWDVHLLVGLRNQFGALGFDTLKVGYISETQANPLVDLMPQTPVTMTDFEVGVMEKTKKLPDGSEKVIGVNVWYRAKEIRSTAVTTPKSSAA